MVRGCLIGREVERFGDEPGSFGAGSRASQDDFGVFFLKGNLGGDDRRIVKDAVIPKAEESLGKEGADSLASDLGINDVSANIEVVLFVIFLWADDDGGVAGAVLGLFSGVCELCFLFGQAAPSGVSTDVEVAKVASGFVEELDLDTGVPKAEVGEAIYFFPLNSVFDLKLAGEVEDGLNKAGVGIVLLGGLHDPGAAFVDKARLGLVGEDLDPSNVLGVELINLIAFSQRR